MVVERQPLVAGTPDLELDIDGGSPSHVQRGLVERPDGVRIAYEVHGVAHGGPAEVDKRPRVLMIMGLACGRSGWRWQLQDLLRPRAQGGAAAMAAAAAAAAAACPRRWSGEQGCAGAGEGGSGSSCAESEPSPGTASCDGVPHQQHQEQLAPMVVCVMDNRGVGDSSAPRGSGAYSTAIMAGDALAVMDQLGWGSAHIVGFSMGGMISTRLAVLAPQRVRSLTLISATAGGWQVVPWSLRGLRRGVRMLMARTPEDQADATLHMHFTKRTLREWVTHHGARRDELLRREYLAPAGPPQPPHGFQGQVHACWHHSVSEDDVRTIREAGFPICVIHGRYDALASPAYGEQLARRLAAPLVMLQGAHFVVRECAGQVNMLLLSLVLGPQHIHAASNAPYLEPDAASREPWAAAAGAPALVGACTQRAGSKQLV